jgi:hypothetical protein
MKKIFLFVLVLCVFGCSNGNSPKVVAVNGTLTQNGTPLADVRIEFNKIDTGAVSFAETDAKGYFTLTHTHGKSGAEPGKYTVSIFRKGQPIPLPANTSGNDVPDELRNQTTQEVPITNSDGSPIEIEITESGGNNIVIDIK